MGISPPTATKSASDTAAAMVADQDGDERRPRLGVSKLGYSGATLKGNGGSNGRSSTSWEKESGGGGGGDRGGGFPSWGLGGVYLAAEAVGAVCDAVGAGPYVVVGYSMGGRVALALAARRPWAIQGGGGLVLVSSSPGMTR